MTKDEAIDILHKMSEDNFYGTHVQEACKMAVEVLLALSLSSNLDEAAKEYFLKTYGIDNIAISEDIKRAVKFGAEWMAGQGETKEGIVVDDDFINFDESATFIDVCPTQETPAFNIKNNEKVIVQIRKIE